MTLLCAIIEIPHGETAVVTSRQFYSNPIRGERGRVMTSPSHKTVAQRSQFLKQAVVMALSLGGNVLKYLLFFFNFIVFVSQLVFLLLLSIFA